MISATVLGPGSFICDLSPQEFVVSLAIFIAYFFAALVAEPRAVLPPVSHPLEQFRDRAFTKWPRLAYNVLRSPGRPCTYNPSASASQAAGMTGTNILGFLPDFRHDPHYTPTPVYHTCELQAHFRLWCTHDSLAGSPFYHFLDI